LQGPFASALGGRFSHLIPLSAFFLRSQMFFTKKIAKNLAKTRIGERANEQKKTKGPD
jgi:hypothetical protein